MCASNVPLYDSLLLAEVTVAENDRGRSKGSTLVARQEDGGARRVLDSYGRRDVGFDHGILAIGGKALSREGIEELMRLTLSPKALCMKTSTSAGQSTIACASSITDDKHHRDERAGGCARRKENTRADKVTAGA